jgi:myo-inositol-1(or 4)-monophosphatase
MDKTVLQSRIDAAERAARLAGEALLRHYNARERLVVDQKGVNDFVSNADREAEDIIAAALRRAFPEDGFLGEETGLSGPEAAEAVWCVDPLDGTSNFLKGAHNWCVSIGLWSGDKPILGVIYDPLRNELFRAADGLGALCNDVPIAVSTTPALDRASIGTGHNGRVPVEDFTCDLARLLGAGASFRQVGAGALMLAYVAAGRVDCYVERHMWPWDAVAGLSLIREAGGTFAPYVPVPRDLARGGAVLASGAPLFPLLEQLLGR